MAASLVIVAWLSSLSDVAEPVSLCAPELDVDDRDAESLDGDVEPLELLYSSSSLRLSLSDRLLIGCAAVGVAGRPTIAD